MSYSSTPYRRPYLAWLTALLSPFAFSAGPARAQTTAVPRPAAGETLSTTGDLRGFDPTHLKDRPYSFNLPAPQFPSTARIDREFVVEYVYDYAFSNYSPEVKLPVAASVDSKRDTPENALIAITSAMRQGDYAAFVKCWDPEDQAKLATLARDGNQGPDYWKKIWGEVFNVGKSTILVDRIETQGYVILDFRLSAPSTVAATQVFKYVNRQWLATNELSRNPLLYNFSPAQAGLIQRFAPLPTAKISPDAVQLLDSQQSFLTQHTVRDRIVQAGR